MDHQPVHHRPAGAQMLPNTTTALPPYGRGRQQGSLLAISRLMRQLRTPRNDVVQNRKMARPERFERPTLRFVDCCGSLILFGFFAKRPTRRSFASRA
jgi:hypothetical protein